MAAPKKQIREKAGMLKLVEKEEQTKKQDQEMAAYFHWLGRGCPSDDALSDWIAVENKWGGESVSERMDVQA